MIISLRFRTLPIHRKTRVTGHWNQDRSEATKKESVSRGISSSLLTFLSLKCVLLTYLSCLRLIYLYILVSMHAISMRTDSDLKAKNKLH